MTDLDAIRQRVEELKDDPDVRVGIAMSLYDYCHQLLAALEECQVEVESGSKLVEAANRAALAAEQQRDALAREVEGLTAKLQESDTAYHEVGEYNERLKADWDALAQRCQELEGVSEGRLKILEEKAGLAHREWIRAEQAEADLARARERVGELEVQVQSYNEAAKLDTDQCTTTYQCNGRTRRMHKAEATVRQLENAVAKERDRLASGSVEMFEFDDRWKLLGLEPWTWRL